ncbi:hypothetical protein HYALB_00003016 [Hymenoscyphus albidus]|uniref:Transposase MuDR plant domain-containing protein n=1 Tax=Hymenoscyphus albidus TaxID=595503 RepID=A0A9N9QDE9_9HELO|nr:hypothetical protein HYALB_00003016 [Hymenoscyphus albidus]
MPPLELRQEFPTLKAFKEALHAWAIEAHFEPRILKSDTGRVRVGCKRDPNCPFVIRCNWERKNGREPLARVTVLKDRHTCLNGLEWTGGMVPSMGINGPMGGMNIGGVGGGVNVGVGGHPANHGMGIGGQVGIREDEEGNIMGGARVLGPVEGRGSNGGGNGLDVGGAGGLPVLPKVQRNSASRLPFLMEILPRVMNIQKETTPMEIRDCLIREYGQEVHLQQCRRAKTEILKKRSNEGDGQQGQNQNQNQGPGQESTHAHAHSHSHTHNPPGSLDGLGGGSESANETANQQLFGELNTNGVSVSTPTVNNHNPQQQHSPHFTLHTAAGVVTPVVPERGSAALRAVGEQPIKCPYCLNHRWMKSIQDAVEHMSMHVTV